jgi:hypothetical protein
VSSRRTKINQVPAPRSRMVTVPSSEVRALVDGAPATVKDLRLRVGPGGSVEIQHDADLAESVRSLLLHAAGLVGLGVWIRYAGGSKARPVTRVTVGRLSRRHARRRPAPRSSSPGRAKAAEPDPELVRRFREKVWWRQVGEIVDVPAADKPLAVVKASIAEVVRLTGRRLKLLSVAPAKVSILGTPGSGGAHIIQARPRGYYH